VREPAADVVGIALPLQVVGGITVQVLGFQLRQFVVLHGVESLDDTSNLQLGIGGSPIMVVKVGKRIFIGVITGVFEAFLSS